MKKLVQFDFPFNGPFGDELARGLTGLAQSIASEPGLLWKIWTENRIEKQAGGIYLFTDDQTASAYVAKHMARLGQFGIKDVNVKVFDVNEELSGVTNGPLG